MFAVFGFNVSIAQSTSSYIFGMDNLLGCQTLSPDNNSPKRGYSFEEIKETDCFKTCKGSKVEYWIYSETNIKYAVDWEVTGGTIDGSSNEWNCKIIWGTVGSGSIKVKITNLIDGSVIERNFCTEIIDIPTANFTIAPSLNLTAELSSCSQQELFFTNLSTANAGASLSYYHWDFGDGTSSYEFQPSHTYSTTGVYTITLRVTNSCNCFTLTSKNITIGSTGINLSCAGVVCDNQTIRYNLPYDAIVACNGSGVWTIVGGTISNSDEKGVNVTWDQTNDTGFGYVTFDPSRCDSNCFSATTIKIPVIQNVGTIKGNANMCAGAQTKYSLPQWPSTEFKWEIVGNENDTLALVLLTDQGNEIVVQPKVYGILSLRCTYYNTLLKCGGTATFAIDVAAPDYIIGPDELCTSGTASFETSSGALKNWTLKDSNNSVVASFLNVSQINYVFTTAGVYKISINGEGDCLGSSKTITVVQLPSLPNDLVLIGTRTNICPNVALDYSMPNMPGFQYQWSVFSGGTFVGLSTGNTVSIKFDTAATHTISIVLKSINNVNCSSPPLNVVVNTRTIPVQITDNLPQAVCPNTSNDYVAIRTNSMTPYGSNADTFNWTITPSTAGSIILGQGTNTEKGIWTFDSAPWPTGVYIVVVKNNNGSQSQYKLLKQ